VICAIRPLAFTTKRAVASYRAIATTMLAAYPFATLSVIDAICSDGRDVIAGSDEQTQGASRK